MGENQNLLFTHNAAQCVTHTTHTPQLNSKGLIWPQPEAAFSTKQFIVINVIKCLPVEQRISVDIPFLLVTNLELSDGPPFTSASNLVWVFWENWQLTLDEIYWHNALSPTYWWHDCRRHFWFVRFLCCYCFVESFYVPPKLPADISHCIRLLHSKSSAESTCF